MFHSPEFRLGSFFVFNCVCVCVMYVSLMLVYIGIGIEMGQLNQLTKRISDCIYGISHYYTYASDSTDIHYGVTAAFLQYNLRID